MTGTPTSNTRPYIQWLCELIENPNENYDRICDVAFEMDFYETVPNDINRCEDGLELRRRFESETGKRLEWSSESCSMLEMLVALAVRMNDIQYDWENHRMEWWWFYCLLENLGLVSPSNPSSETIEGVLQAVVTREYHPSGKGGLFPLSNAKDDQRQIEIWYQMHAWLNELLE